jgi:histidyl-tRNA synthetase
MTAVLDKAHVPQEMRRNVCQLLCQLHLKHNWKQVKSQLLSQIRLTEKCVETLESIVDIKGNIDDVVTRLRELLPSHPPTSQALNDMLRLSHHLSCFGMSRPIMFEPGFVYNFEYYQSGMMFQVVLDQPKKLEVLAAGGR